MATWTASPGSCKPRPPQGATVPSLQVPGGRGTTKRRMPSEVGVMQGKCLSVSLAWEKDTWLEGQTMAGKETWCVHWVSYWLLSW